MRPETMLRFCCFSDYNNLSFVNPLPVNISMLLQTGCSNFFLFFIFPLSILEMYLKRLSKITPLGKAVILSVKQLFDITLH